jgi:hypothetical protein
MFDSLEVKVLYTPTRGSVSGGLDYAQTDFVVLMRRDSGRLACLPLIRFEIHFKAVIPRRSGRDDRRKRHWSKTG